jgi:hypothetical protein
MTRSLQIKGAKKWPATVKLRKKRKILFWWITFGDLGLIYG